MRYVLSDLGLDKKDILANIYAVNDRLFTRIFAYDVLVEKGKCPLVRRSSKPDDKRETESKIVPYDASERPLERELKYFMAHLHSAPEISSGQAGLDVVRTLETVLAEDGHG